MVTEDCASQPGETLHFVPWLKAALLTASMAGLVLVQVARDMAFMGEGKRRRSYGLADGLRSRGHL